MIGQPRLTKRYDKRTPEEEALLRQRIIELASQGRRYGYRWVTALLRNEGRIVNHKYVQCIWREEGLKVPQKLPKRGRLWLNDGSLMRLRPLFPKHVWSYDFMEDRTYNVVKFRNLNVIDEYTRECLAIKVNRRLNSHDIVEVLKVLFIQRGVLVHIRSDNCLDFIAKRFRTWSEKLQVRSLYIQPGSSWENGYV